MWSHLGLKPGLQISAVLVSDGFIVLADTSHDSVEVFLWRGVHLHVHLSAHLGPSGQELLKGTR